ncbi:MAG: ketoacyl-ACP synthase III [Defluviitaleaceae bacterium]|nr:ketoacyl-ACP synthase III [Defluviitaleaceae bacterium]MCL2837256.1 ketoacyl-ACP synthase III [Defluviitaleaceae bacterium]
MEDDSIGTRIVGAARSLPELVVTNDDLAALVETSDEWIHTRSGIRTRHISRGESVSTLASDVFRKLVSGAGYDPDDIDLLILATVTPEYLTPSSATFVLRETGAKNAFAFDINAACTGFVYAVSVADKMLRSGLYKKAIVIAGDTLSKFVDWTDRATCVLFADGAGGVLMEACDGAPCILAEDLHTDGSYAMSLRAAKLPIKNPWYEDPGPEEPYVIMDGKAIYDFVVTEIPKSVRAILEKAAMTIDDIKYVICHQANSRIIEGVAKKLKTGIDKFYISISRYGNTSASSMPIALSEMMEKGLVHKGDRIIISGFGAGLTWGSLLVQF